ncbi:MAG: tRNA pseudouridine(38-40) synthase TruA [Chloroflexi bacterium]|nr:tRNA pseudouridine(38-40) synthase TruA [Chloroflexota bacterium]
MGKTTANAEGSRRFRLVLEYDGIGFHGFQWQKTQRTVQSELETALARLLTDEGIRVIGAGRTDAGAHALGQVVHFTSATKLPAEALMRGLNALLPADVAVREAKEVDSTFHARYRACSREYRYTILNRKAPSPLKRYYAYHFQVPLDVAVMDEACQELIGEHDLAAFSGKTTRNPVRRILSARCWREEELVFFEVVGTAFLPQMVRTVAGTILWVGVGKLDRDGFRMVLQSRDRALAGPTLPAHGLCLMQVNYE